MSYRHASFLWTRNILIRGFAFPQLRSSTELCEGGNLEGSARGGGIIRVVVVFS